MILENIKEIYDNYTPDFHSQGDYDFLKIDNFGFHKEKSFDEKSISFKEEFGSQDEKLNFENGEFRIQKENKEFESFDVENKGLSNAKTKVTTKTLGLKRKREDDEQITFGFKDYESNLDFKYSEYYENNKNSKKTQGRKKKDEKEKGNHTKYSFDNIMRKIKSNFMDFCHKLLNRSIKDRNLQFLKLNSKINENLKRDYNIELFNKTIQDLYENSSISSKYRKQIKECSHKNKLIVQEIYKRKDEEIEAIKILNLTYGELFQIFRKKILDISPELENKINGITLLQSDEFNDINKFFNEIREQEVKKEESLEDIDEYLNNVKSLCLTYEDWFNDKKGRNRNKKEKN